MREPVVHHPLIGTLRTRGGWGEPPRSRETSQAYRLLPQRALALLVDALVWVGMVVIAGILFGTEVPAETPDGTVMQDGVAFRLGPLGVYLVSCLWLGYLATTEWRFGATLGKRVLGLRVVQSDESRVGVRSVAWRHVIRLGLFTFMFLNALQLLVPLIFIAEAIVASSNQRRQRVGDQFADTVVLHRWDLGARDGSVPSPMAVPNAGATPPASVAYAGFWQRAVALIVDTAVLFVVYEVLASVGPAASAFSFGLLKEASTGDASLLPLLAPTIVSAAYFIVLNGRGATLGKRLTGIRVVDRAGNAPGLKRSIVRYLIPLVAALFALGAAVTTTVAGTDSPNIALALILLAFALAGSLIVLIDGLSMLWSEHRQALHDRMAGTLVLQGAGDALLGHQRWAGSAAGLTPAPRRMARRGVVTGLAIGLLLLAGMGTLGYRAVQRAIDELEDSVVASMTDTLRASASDIVGAGAGDSNAIHFREGDVTVNNAVELGYVGWESTTAGTEVFGVELSIDPDGIALGSGYGVVMYSGVPVVIDGRIELTDVRGDGDIFADVIDQADFERIIESGLNDALAEHGLVPTDLALREGVLSVKVEAVPDSR